MGNEIHLNLSDAQKKALINEIKENIREGYYNELDAIHTKAREAVKEEEEQTQEQENNLNWMIVYFEYSLFEKKQGLTNLFID